VSKWRRAFFNWLRWKVYTKRDQVFFTSHEILYLIDIVDAWVEEHQRLVDADDIEGVYMNMAVAIDVREKLWRQISQ